MAEVATIAAKSYAYLQGDTVDFKSKKGEKWYMPYVSYCYENGIYTTKDVENRKVSLEKSQNWNRPAQRIEVAGMLGRVDDFYGKAWINPDVPLTDIGDVHKDMAFHEEVLILYRLAGLVLILGNWCMYRIRGKITEKALDK